MSYGLPMISRIGSFAPLNHLVHSRRISTGQNQLSAPHGRQVSKVFKEKPAAIVGRRKVIDDDAWVVLLDEAAEVELAASNLVHMRAHRDQSFGLEEKTQHLDRVVVGVENRDGGRACFTHGV